MRIRYATITFLIALLFAGTAFHSWEGEMSTRRIVAGINGPWDPAGIKAAASRGARVYRVGWESTWSLTQLQGILTTIRSNGMKATVAITPASRLYTEPGFNTFATNIARMMTAGEIIEVHNEPNHKPFAAAPDARGYAAEFVNAMNAIRTAQPGVQVIIGGLSPEAGALDPRHFLVAMIQANAKVLNADGLALHPYEFPFDPRSFNNSWNPVGYLDTGSQYPSINDILIYCGRPNFPIHLTEFGAPSGRTDGAIIDPQYPTAPYRYTEEMQAQWLSRYLEAFQRSKANIVAAYWFALNDGERHTGLVWEPYVGLRRPTGTWKPVSQVFRTWAIS